MPPRLSWRHLYPGLIALTVMVLAGVAVLKFAAVGKVKGETVRIHVLTDQARGVIPGTEVWVDGQKAGAVHHIGFRAPSADTMHRVVIAADVQVEPAARLRSDSRIRVRAGGSVIGPVVVFIESGTPSGVAVRAGDTLRSLGQSDAELVLERLAPATAELPALLADAKTVMKQTRNPEGTVGAFLTRGMPAEFTQLKANVSALRGRGGTTTDEKSESPLRRKTSAVMARVDSIRALIASTESSFGRFRRDSSLRGAVAELRADLDALQRDMDESSGTLSRLRSDSAMTRSIAAARREMALLFEDMTKHPLRYINF